MVWTLLVNIIYINFRIQRNNYPSFPQLVQPDQYNQTATHYFSRIGPSPGYFTHKEICAFREYYSVFSGIFGHLQISDSAVNYVRFIFVCFIPTEHMSNHNE